MNEDIDKLLQSAEPGKREFTPVTPGDYHAEITKAVLEDAKDNRPMRVQWEYTITDQSGFANRKIWENNQLTSTGMPFFVENLDKLGITKPSKVAEIPNSLEQALGKRVVIKVTNKPKSDGNGVWVNGYIQQVIEHGQMPEDDVPF